MHTVRIRGEVRAAIIAHAHDEAPNECCGLLVGAGACIEDAVRTTNLHASPTRYLLDPAQHIATNRRLRGTARSVIGVYHSHPSTPAMPSATDCAEALYPDFIWVIVSLLVADAEVAAFRLTEHRVTPLTLVVEP